MMYAETPALSNWLANNPETSLGEFYYHSFGYLDCTLYLKKIGVNKVSCRVLTVGWVHSGKYSQTSVSRSLLLAGASYGFEAIVFRFL
jgi:hypothetical protein